MPKELMLICLIAFNLTVMVYGFYRVLTQTSWTFGARWEPRASPYCWG